MKPALAQNRISSDPKHLGVVAIIPARGKSRGIPRKNARLLDGRPLILHVIRAAQQARYIDTLFVTTDDPELAELARRSGTAVIERPAALAGPEVTLDEVIVDAVQRLERGGRTIDHVVTLQSTSPLLSPRTIDAAIVRCRQHDHDTVVSVVNDTHLSWGLDEAGKPVPLYDKRLNRQELAPVYRETGAVVVARRQVLDSGSRFGRDVGLIEVSKAESIDIDDNFDWWLADKSLRRRRIVFNIIGNPQQGLGHVYRALTLADHLIDHELLFLTNNRSQLAADMVRDRFYPVEMVAPGEELGYLLANPPDLLINDVLETSEWFVSAIKGAGSRVINFEDLGRGSRQADRVINAMYDVHPHRRDDHVFHGVEYCCLRDEFYTTRPIRTKPQVENVLLLFGGTDPSGLTEQYLRWLDAQDAEFTITVISGIGFERKEALQRIADTARHPVEVVYDTAVISRYMANADLAVTSAGRTVFELAALAVPMVVVAHHAREKAHVFSRSTLGAVFLGSVDEVDESQFGSALNELLASELLRKKMSAALREARVHDGVHRVLDIIEGLLSEREQEELS
ncbi:MAG: NTP transferase domain-containing protein [bacterium]